MRRRAFTLIELLIAITILGILIGALTSTYISSVDQDARLRAGRDEVSARLAFESRVADLIRHAYLSADSADTTTYFVAEDLGAGSAETMTFTVLGQRVPRVVMDSTDDFETLNERFGPQGGVTEISLSVTPVGNAPTSTGLFLREQRPSDGDPTQGGYESRLEADVSQARFEFWDGQQWLPSWDTRTQTERRLPASIRMTYRLTEDAVDRVYVIRVPGSDVTANNPLTQGTETQ
ncbi:MAG: prepilin-type N-terminal cleavage/methylation domain-containing protein [Fimbriimonas sp.]